MTHKNAPPQTPDQLAFETFWISRKGQGFCGFSRDKNGEYHAEFARDAYAAWTCEKAASRGATATATIRRGRQIVVHTWCIAAFGDDHARSIEQRGIRLVEEAIEAGQACGCNAEMIHRLVDHIFAKPIGELSQELGGVSVTMLALAEAAGIDANECELVEIERILAKPLAHFAARNAAKNAAGFNVLAGTHHG